jgi:ubiquinone/menaquinone biosynthesis C-methylase UbiE
MDAVATLIHDEIDVLASLWSAPQGRVIELGCGAARMAQHMLQRWPNLSYLGLEVDAKQHALNRQTPRAGMRFAEGGAQCIDAPDATFDLALMLKSLHHLPIPDMDRAIVEVARVLKPGGLLYVSEPVYTGPLNDIVRLYNDEGMVRTAAQAALDRALRTDEMRWTQLAECHFDMPVRFASFAEFEQRMMRPTYADHQIDESLLHRVSMAFAPHLKSDGADFVRPMHVRMMRKTA